MIDSSLFGFRHKPKKKKSFWEPTVQRFDVATRIEIGARAYQQDALLENFAAGDAHGIAVLADGMGGHLGGHLASAIAVGAAFSAIKISLVQASLTGSPLAPILKEAVERANEGVANGVNAKPEFDGMGTTLVACMTFGNQLYWASVGDSPLYLYRDGALQQLNEDHSMGPRIDALVTLGMMTEEVAATHPQRAQLMSALCGDEIESIDCPDHPFDLAAGDILILASDGLQTLSNLEMSDVLKGTQQRTAAEIAHELIQAVADRGRTEQDNVSLMLLKVLTDEPVTSMTESTADPNE